MSAKRNRPTGNRAAQQTAGKASEHSLARPTDAPLLAKRRDYGVRVTFERADGRVCAQVFANLDAAERKARRCRERGLLAQLHLVRLVPVGVVPDDVSVPALAALLEQDGGGAR
ncbi:MAG TPA: hypothetical protein VFL73_02945 [Solirubrobacteraceae bacterium]|nr:hypothetical protein [Solirubrobacteraceae bacterium]